MAKSSELNAIFRTVDIESPNINDLVETMINPHRIFIHPIIGNALNYDEREKTYDIQNQKVKQQQLEATRKLHYKAGFEEIISNGSLINGYISKDSFGYKWFICSTCGQIQREDEMVIYSGTSGTCRECSRKQ